ncbi:anti-sigma factor domain-containing protein [Thermobrachium celere]|uniref:RsgI N-terminal anti-sigma domain-containing protein n=1 Tax=Thermobrachium celere DSM 8682 TaxID=941824 RepID=R7RQS3_9CLOT|nr:anti-sigma factor domain-containing protein [Thermobrachium celere]CDF57600.1 hypothetical protein TCEL_01514 [Thermobrachium celere DSM 8682]
MIKKGIVVEVNNNEAVLFTQTGEFIKFKSKEKLQIGQEYTYTSINLKPFLIAASLIICILFGSFLTVYNQVYASIVITINPKIKIDINKFNRIIKIIPLNKDGEEITSSIKLKNKNINDGLILIINKAKEKKYITDEYYNNKSKKINIQIDKEDIKLNKFISELKKQNINFVKVYDKVQNTQDKQKDELIKQKTKPIPKDNNEKEVPSNKIKPNKKIKNNDLNNTKKEFNKNPDNKIQNNKNKEKYQKQTSQYQYEKNDTPIKNKKGIRRD